MKEELHEIDDDDTAPCGTCSLIVGIGFPSHTKEDKDEDVYESTKTSSNSSLPSLLLPDAVVDPLSYATPIQPDQHIVGTEQSSPPIRSRTPVFSGENLYHLAVVRVGKGDVIIHRQNGEIVTLFGLIETDNKKR
jgi:hypothetical protein